MICVGVLAPSAQCSPLGLEVVAKSEASESVGGEGSCNASCSITAQAEHAERGEGTEAEATEKRRGGNGSRGWYAQEGTRGREQGEERGAAVVGGRKVEASQNQCTVAWRV